MSEREDATARALDQLPTSDPAVHDPRLLRDPELTAIGREVREAATDVWLAVSPLRAAPPEALSTVMEKIGATGVGPVATASGVRWLRWAAASGWAAAALAVVAWWLQQDGGPAVSQRMAAGARERNRAIEDGASAAGGGFEEAPALPVSRRDRRLEDEVGRLRRALAANRASERDGFQPRVLGLHAPGKAPRTGDQNRDRLLGILTDALKSTLEAQTGAPGDPATLVIERGWLPEGLTVEDEGLVLRHRHFPEEEWVQLGLMRSEEGNYYDPSNGLVWKPDADGRGFIGRKAGAADDLTAYAGSGGTATGATALVQKEPEGFLIADPQSGVQRLVVSNLSPAEAGSSYVLNASVNGAPRSVTLDAGQIAFSNGLAMIDLSHLGQISSLQLVQTSSSYGTFNGVTTNSANNNAAGGKVILSSGP